MKYEYGVEYETNGKKPDLPDDVLVDVKCKAGKNEWCGYIDLKVDGVCWKKSCDHEVEASSFRIVDERYKPVEVEQVQVDWYDYDKQRATGFAPDKTRCQVQCGESWQDGLLIASHGDSGWFLSDCGGTFFLTKERFRPLDYNRKADEERQRFVDKAKAFLPHVEDNLIQQLWYAGCRFTENKAAL